MTANLEFMSVHYSIAPSKGGSTTCSNYNLCKTSVSATLQFLSLRHGNENGRCVMETHLLACLSPVIIKGIRATYSATGAISRIIEITYEAR